MVRCVDGLSTGGNKGVLRLYEMIPYAQDRAGRFKRRFCRAVSWFFPQSFPLVLILPNNKQSDHTRLPV